MKLSEMNTEQMARAMCLMAAPLERIGRDEKISGYFKKRAEKGLKGETQLSLYAGMIGELVPVLLQEHKEDVYTVLSALTGKSTEEIAKQKGLQTIKDAKECFDGELLDFFK